MATKKEGAQRLLDSLDSAVRIKQRLWLAIAQGVIISVTVAWFTRWQFGVAASLVFVLLIQLAFERMSNSIAASKLQALNDLGWSTEADSDEQLREKAEKILSEDDKTRIEVSKADGEKCQRCWKILEKKCDRCSNII